MPKFSGGTRIDSKHYLTIKAGPHRNRRVHILVAEAMLGRKLEPHEVVNHRNLNKLDCDWRNLEVMDVRKHGAVSARQRWYLKTHVWNREEESWEEYLKGLQADVDEWMGRKSEQGMEVEQ